MVCSRLSFRQPCRFSSDCLAQAHSSHHSLSSNISIIRNSRQAQAAVQRRRARSIHPCSTRTTPGYRRTSSSPRPPTQPLPLLLPLLSIQTLSIPSPAIFSMGHTPRDRAAAAWDLLLPGPPQHSSAQPRARHLPGEAARTASRSSSTAPPCTPLSSPPPLIAPRATPPPLPLVLT